MAKIAKTQMNSNFKSFLQAPVRKMTTHSSSPSKFYLQKQRLRLEIQTETVSKEDYKTVASDKYRPSCIDRKSVV